jgi:uncharacterized protein with FMN-binding domain
MSSNVKPLIALGLTAVGTVLVANFQVSEPAITVADVGTDATPSTSATAAPQSTTSSTESATTGTTTSTTTARVGSTATPTPTAAPTETTTTTPGSGTTYTDGTYAGAAVNEPWGTFEVQVTISGGQIADVQLVASPRDRHSSAINSQAVPMLTEEVIAAQSANIDMLSGATWTSQSYITSLQAALDGALAAELQPAG